MGFLKRLFGKDRGSSQPEEKIDLDLPFEHIIVKGIDAVEKLNELRSNAEITPVANFCRAFSGIELLLV